MRHFFKWMFKVYYQLFYGVEVHNAERLPKEGAYLLCANHLSAQDPFVIGPNLKPEVKIMAKKELFKIGIVGWFLRVNGGFPVDRAENDISAIKTSLQILKQGTPLFLFPEGTRNLTTTPLKAKPGIAMIAVRAKVPIVPITLKSDYKFFKKMHIYIGEPVDLSEYHGSRVTGEQYQAIAQDIVDKIYEVLQ